ncbi:putative vacuolar protein sorting-associated protein [Helianthus annuus]|nr:putative vacuolar protein sorting-associated protein [Helianthus annuus]
MGNFLCCFTTTKETKPFPIDTDFKFSSPLPSWPPGEGFANGTIDLGGLQVCQITSFTKIWSSSDGGSDDNGATFFEPNPIPEGFSMLGCYCQSNATPLFGWVLAGKDVSGGTLASPVDYKLVLSVDSSFYIWLPTPPDGYNPVGYAITSSSEKPPLDKIKCVRVDLTDESETDGFLWGADDGVSVYSSRPKTRGAQAPGVCVGTFVVEDENNSYPMLSCLKNNNFSMLSSFMPNLAQIKALVQEYSPRLYFHPSETYLPSSTTWYFSNGVLLYHAGDESNPILVEPTGSNLPQGGSNDGAYWLDLPIDETERVRVKKGDLQSCQVYIHVKPTLGATFSDIVIWVFYPFNGPSTAKLGFIDVPLGKIGEHIGDWEHMTMRISNFNGLLHRVYFAQHSGGRWIDTTSLEFQSETNNFIGYSSLHGHATYHTPGVVLQGTDVAGIRNDTAKSDMFLDVGASYSIMAAEYIDSIIEPSWLNYARKWGPKITYETRVELEKLKNSSGILESTIESLLEILPNEVFEEDGPTGPKMKDYWEGDER